ncbi:MAG: class I SAM-dependent methyltransferase [Mycobacteriales bacterium]
MTRWSLEQAYDAYPRIEEEFSAALDESLHPRGPDVLYDLVAGMGLPPGAVALDVGCGEGGQALALRQRFRFRVTGIDPVPRHLEVARAAAGADGPTFTAGTAEDLPAGDGTADLVWCRDVLVHVADLPRAYAEFRRVLRPGGRVLVYQVFGTDLLEPREAAWLFDVMGVVPTSADPARTDAAIAAAGLVTDQCLHIGTEWGEWAEEHRHHVGRKLLHAARLRRDPARYRDRFGGAAYDMMLGDCLWHVYALLGKLTRRAYLLTVP